jgi:hypothetical protein
MRGALVRSGRLYCEDDDHIKVESNQFVELVEAVRPLFFTRRQQF